MRMGGAVCGRCGMGCVCWEGVFMGQVSMYLASFPGRVGGEKDEASMYRACNVSVALTAQVLSRNRN